MYPLIHLKPGRERSIEYRHPWIFSGAVERSDKRVQDGDLVTVCGPKERFLAQGYFCKDASISVKLLSFEREEIGPEFWLDRIRSAHAMRQRLGYTTDPENTAYRLINAEGDSLPGLIVDVYGKTAVMQCQTSGMQRRKDEIITALRKHLGSEITDVFDKTADDGAEGKKSDADSRIGTGEILEGGKRFKVDWKHGQKTGFFLDQRLNRKMLGEFAKGKNVLNAFCYTGGFSVYALCGGAKKVVSVDSSRTALTTLEENVAMSGHADKHETISADFLKYMQTFPKDFDLIVLDPPAFAKQRAALNSGMRGYRSINSQALKAIKSGGVLFTFSCSQLVTRDAFRKMIFESAIEAKRSVQIIAQLHQSPCHPVSVYHPEGEYLKGLVLAVD